MGLVCAGWAHAVVSAQAPAREPGPAPAPDSATPSTGGDSGAPAQPSERIAPAIVTLPELELPQGAAPSEAELEALVEIDVEGRARLIESSAQGELRERIEALLGDAVFKPATIRGEPQPSRVRVRFAVRAEPRVPDAGEGESLEGAAPAPQAAAPADPREQFAARAEIDPPRPAARKLVLAEMREVPGAFGDPFRVLDTLPGVVPLFSGLPYVYVRGAPPAGTVYVYDEIAVPALFHLALGPAVVHPAMIGDLHFYSAVPPARYGRRTGGVFAAEGPKLELHAPLRGEAELRLIDLQAMLDVPVLDGRVIAAGRYGYPGLLLSIFAEDAVLAYWDYQLRVVQPISRLDRVELSWFGSYDKAGDREDPEEGLVLEFHRAEARLVRERSDYEIGLALQGGYEVSQLGEEVKVEAARLGPRIWSRLELGAGARLRMGADLLGTAGSITVPDDGGGEASGAPSEVDPGSASLPPGAERPVPGPMQAMMPIEEQQEESAFDDPLYAAVAGRNQAGVYAELELPLDERWKLEPGLRADTWLSGGDAQSALEPRLLLSYRASELLTLHTAGGLGHQPASLPIPLPGFSDVALEHGLQESYQVELGAALTPLETLRIEAELFFSHLTDLLLPELFFLCGDLDDEEENDPRCGDQDGIPRGDVTAYGVELFVKRDVKETVSGWLSYTLGFADGSAGELSFTPEYDVRHVGNLVVLWRMGAGFSLGGRLHYRSGKARNASVEDSFGGELLRLPIERRLPGFFRADARIAYGWGTSWGRMRVALEWFNLTMSREATDLECSLEAPSGEIECEVQYAPAIFFPNLGLYAQF